MIIPDAVRSNFFDNPVGGLAMSLVGPLPLRLVFRAFVVVVGVLMLAGAVNTAIVGSNGVLNRISEDGIMPHWFRHPHRRFFFFQAEDGIRDLTVTGVQTCALPI